MITCIKCRQAFTSRSQYRAHLRGKPTLCVLHQRRTAMRNHPSNGPRPAG